MAEINVDKNDISVEVVDTEFDNLALKYLAEVRNTPETALVLGGFLCIGVFRCGFLCISLARVGPIPADDP